jgi:hypothetical protein
MKKLFTLTMLISFAMICSCQKQDSAAEQQLAQRKAELDAREKALAEREKATTNIRRIPADVQRRIPDPAQVQAQRDKRRQQMLEQLQRMNSGAARSPAATFTNPSAASPAVEATSPTPSPTPQ